MPNRRHSPSLISFLVLLISVILLATFCYLLLTLLLPTSLHARIDVRRASKSAARLLRSLERMATLRQRYMTVLKLPSTNFTQILTTLETGKLDELLLLEPIILQMSQWADYEALVEGIPKWIDRGIEGLAKTKGKRLAPELLRDRYDALRLSGEGSIKDIQQSLIGLQQTTSRCQRRLQENFQESASGVLKITSQNITVDSHKATWLDAVKHDIGDLVRQIESSGGDIFGKLHKAGLAHLETVIKLPNEESEAQMKVDNTTTPFLSPGLIDPGNNRFALSRPANLAFVGEDGHLLLELAIILVTSTLFGALFEALSLPAFLGYLSAGMLLGPSCLDQVQNIIQITTLGQAALLIIVLFLGIEFSLEKIRLVWKSSLLITLFSTAVVVLFATFVGIYLLKISAGQSIVTGLIISLSSTVIAIKCLQTGEKPSSSPIGRSVMGVLIVQDIFFCILLATIPLLSERSQETLALVKVVAIFLIKMGIFSLISGMLLKIVAKLVPSILLEHFKSMALIISISLLGNRYGVNLELAVFITSVFVASISPGGADEEQLVQRTKRISLFYDAVSIFFFASVGLLIDVRFLWGEKYILLPLAVLIVLIKGTVLLLTSKMVEGGAWESSLTMGVVLAQVSELALMLGARARRAGLLSIEAYHMIAGVTALSMAISPLLWRLFIAIFQTPARMKKNSTIEPIYCSVDR